MLYPIAIEMGNSNQAFGVVVPDLQGCFSAGDSLEEAINNAKEAVEFYLEDLAERGKLPPPATALADWVDNEEYQGWEWAMIDVE